MEFIMGVMAGLTVAMIAYGLIRAQRESVKSKEKTPDLKSKNDEFYKKWTGLQCAVCMKLIEDKTGRKDKTIDKIIHVERTTGKSILELYADDYDSIALRYIFSEDDGSLRSKDINDKPKEE